MRHFVYTYSENTPRNGHTRKTVRLFRIVRNEPKFIAEATDIFVGHDQLVMQTLEAHKALPKAAFERHQYGGFKHGLWSLKQAGIARVTQL